MALPELWGLRRLATRPYPVTSVASTHPVNVSRFDIKDFLQRETLSRLYIRVKGNIVVAGAAPGTATGKDTEQLIALIQGRTNPTLGIVNKNQLSARSIVDFGIFDRGYAIRAAALTDVAGTQAVDFFLPLIYKQPGSVNPIEWALPLSAFENYNLDVSAGGRDQLFTGGTNTWDLSGLTIELWGDFDDGVAGKFHAVEQLEQIVPITQTQPDLQIFLERGFFYTHIMFIAERDNARDNTLINNLQVQSAGRIWTPPGEANAAFIQRDNREMFALSAAEALTGLYFIRAFRDGMYKRSIDAMENRLEIKLDVTLGAGTVRQVRLNVRRIMPLLIDVKGRAG